MRPQVSNHIWQAMDEALAQAYEAGRPVQLWWRDDDAITATPALNQLLGLRKELALPLLLAVIPAFAEKRLFERLAEEDQVWIGLHGYAHQNHATADEKKRELGLHRGEGAVLAELSQGIETLRTFGSDHFLPILIPPWNRIDDALLPALPEIGLKCLSTFGTPPGQSKIAWLNTHLDPIDWRGSRSLADPEAMIRLFCDYIVNGEQPIGFLTHHLVHDEAIWRFTEDFLTRLARHPFVSWPNVPVLAGLGG